MKSPAGGNVHRSIRVVRPDGVMRVNEDQRKGMPMGTPQQKPRISVAVVVKAPLDVVWRSWTLPDHITQWNHATADWHTPKAMLDLRAGGRFLYRMEAKDGSSGFDLIGTFDHVTIHESIAYTLVDGRKVEVRFGGNGNITTVVETFEAESMHSLDQQREGWQSILNNFKTHVEGRS